MAAAPSAARTGDQIFPSCMSHDAEPASYCLNYVRGAVDVLVTHSIICVPSDISDKSLQGMVAVFLYQNPHIRYANAAELIELALKDVMPC